MFISLSLQRLQQIDISTGCQNELPTLPVEGKSHTLKYLRGIFSQLVSIHFFFELWIQQIIFIQVGSLHYLGKKLLKVPAHQKCGFSSAFGDFKKKREACRECRSGQGVRWEMEGSSRAKSEARSYTMWALRAQPALAELWILSRRIWSFVLIERNL